MPIRFCIFLLIIAFSILSASAQKGANKLPPTEGDAAPKPTLVSAPQPVYPAEVKDAGIGGKVSVRVVVDEAGKVLSVDQAIGPARLCGAAFDDPRLVALRQSMIDSMKQAKFEPAMKDGKPVRSVAFVSSTFVPEDGDAGKKKIENFAVGLVKHAEKLRKPEYPSEARAARASGPVKVRVVVDHLGKTVTAEVVSGNSLLHGAAISAACDARFTPLVQNGEPKMMSGFIVYNFVP
jgi:TonB family protein